MNDEKNEIKKFIQRFIKIDSISDDDNIFTTGVVNSLFVMQLVLFIEKNYEIAVDNDIIGTDEFNSINSISKYIYNADE